MSDKIYVLIFIFSFFILAISCKTGVLNPDLLKWNDSEELIFHTGFNNTTIFPISSSMDGIAGIDTTFNTANDWDKLEEHENIGRVRINYEDGTKSQRYAQITSDPTNSSNDVLMFKIIEPHIKEGLKKKGRVNMFIYKNNNLREVYQTVRIYLHPDMEYLKQWDEKFSWLTLFEFWNRDNKYKNQFRVNVNIVKKDYGITDELYFRVHGDKNKIFGGWKIIWDEISTDFSIPFGEWIDLELYIKEGDENSGRFYMAVIYENKSKQVLFNINNMTQHPKDKILNGFTGLNSMKLYTSDKLIDFMKNNSKNLEVYWDDWELYKYKTP